jgi:hypothetical protein
MSRWRNERCLSDERCSYPLALEAPRGHYEDHNAFLLSRGSALPPLLVLGDDGPRDVSVFRRRPLAVKTLAAR